MTTQLVTTLFGALAIAAVLGGGLYAAARREITERGRAFLNKWTEEEEKRNGNTTH